MEEARDALRGQGHVGWGLEGGGDRFQAPLGMLDGFDQDPEGRLRA
jgi:hypothetical protein